jgi:DNA-binding HxlR family transcriptional regulator
MRPVPGPEPERDDAPRRRVVVATLERPDEISCCPRLHETVELVGKRWSGAILLVMMDGPLRFSEIRALVPDISDRLLSERLKELESEGKRWSGAIVYVLLHGGTMRFSQIAHAVPALSDRLLSERLKELEARGIVERRVSDGSPVKVEYELTERGRDLRDAIAELKAWGDRWLL